MANFLYKISTHETSLPPKKSIEEASVQPATHPREWLQERYIGTGFPWLYLHSVQDENSFCPPDYPVCYCTPKQF